MFAMETRIDVLTGKRCIGPRLLIQVALLLMMTWGCIGAAEARESVRLVTLGEDRYLVVRTSAEGVILHFMGQRSSPDDQVVLLPDRRYVADVCWLSAANTVVIATGPGETPVDVYGYERDGRRLYRRRSRQEEGERLTALPGDSLVVVSSCSLAEPPEVANAATGEWMTGYLTWPWDRRDSRERPVLRHGNLCVLDGGLLVLADRSDTETKITLQDIGADEPRWQLRSTTGFAPTVVDLTGVTSLDSTLAWFAPGGSSSRIAAGSGWAFLDAAVSEHRLMLTGVDDDGAMVLSLDRDSGELLAATRLPGASVTLVAEPEGDRLLAIVADRRGRGHLLVLDQSTLEFQEALANPRGWYVHAYWPPRVLATADGSLCLVPARIGGHPGNDPETPRSLVVTWGETVGVHWLDAPADLTADGRVLVAEEREMEGGIRDVRIKEWRP